MRSGWFRVWVVATLTIWTAGVVHMYFADRYNEVMLPPIMDRRDLCAYSWGSEPSPDRGGIELYDSIDEALAASVTLARDECVTDDALYAEAQEWAWRRFQLRSRPYLPYWIAPMMLGLLMIGVGWVRRGFASTPTA